MNVPRLENGAAERVNGAWRMELPGFQGAGPLVGFEVGRGSKLVLGNLNPCAFRPKRPLLLRTRNEGEAEAKVEEAAFCPETGTGS